MKPIEPELPTRLSAEQKRDLTPEEAQAAFDAAPEVPLSDERIQAIVNFAVSSQGCHQVLTLEELTERFYLVRGQRNKLLWACKKALAAFDKANKTGMATWGGKDVDEMRVAVEECEPRSKTTRTDYFSGKPLLCACCGAESTNPGQFVKDGRWVCTEDCRKNLPNVDSYDDLRASGGIVDAP